MCLKLCLHAKNTWLSNAKAYFNISSRFSTTYFQQGRALLPMLPLKLLMPARIKERKLYSNGLVSY